MKLINVLKGVLSIILFPFVLIVTILVFISAIIILPVGYIPFTLYKKLVDLVAKCAYPGSSQLRLLDSALAITDFHKDRDFYLYSQLNFEGRINYEDFVETFDTRVVEKQIETSGRLLFPELKSYIDTFMGYFIRIPDKSFDIKNHLQLHSSSSSTSTNSYINGRELDKIVKDFSYTLFPVKRSPWQCLFVNNVKMDEESDQEHSVVAFKYHHCMADGYSSLILMWEALLQQKLENFAKPKLGNVVRKNAFKRFTANIGVVLSGFKTVLTQPLYLALNPKIMFDENEWHKPGVLSDYARCKMKIETSLVKEISVENNVTITTVILAAVTGGLRRMMEDNGYKSPKSIRIAHSLPLPNHPQTLTSHSVTTHFNNKLSSRETELMDKSLLRHNEREMKMAIRPALALAETALRLCDPYPVAWSRYFVSSQMQAPFSYTTFCGTVPLPQPPNNKDVEFLGSRLVGCYASINMAGATNITTTVFVVKYRKHFFVNYGIQQHLLKNQDDIYKIENYVSEELVHLQNLSAGENKLDLFTCKGVDIDNPILVSDSTDTEQEHGDGDLPKTTNREEHISLIIAQDISSEVNP